MTSPESPDDPIRNAPPTSPTGPSAALRARVLEQAAARPSPTRRAVVRETIGLAAISWLFALAVFAYAGGPRITGRPLGLVFGTATGTAFATALVVWAALSNGRSSLSRAPRVLLPAIVGAPIAIFMWKLFWSSRYPGGLDAWLTRTGFRCLGLGLAMGLFPLIAFTISRRASDPGRPALAGLTAGVAIGCAVALLTDLWCPVAYLPHLLLGHVLPIALLGGLGASLGRRVVALREPRSRSN
jgi:hypothetical protein